MKHVIRFFLYVLAAVMFVLAGWFWSGGEEHVTKVICALGVVLCLRYADEASQQIP